MPRLFVKERSGNRSVKDDFKGCDAFSPRMADISCGAIKLAYVLPEGDLPNLGKAPNDGVGNV